MFDIDKLYLSRKNYHFISDTFDETTGFDADFADMQSLFSKYRRKKQNRLSDSYPSESSEYYQNKLIDNYISILCDVVDIDGKKTTRSMHMLHASIDNHTELLTDIDDDLQEGHKKQTLKPFDAYMLRKQNATKNDFITGKFGIGPFALNNNNHILTMLYGVRFAEKEGSILTRLGMSRLDIANDLDGRSILAWLSGLINLHVDVAKDPRIGRLNVNPYTYNLVNLMVRTGFGKRTFWFTTQPIMKALANAYNNSKGSYMNDPGMSATRRAKIAEEHVIVNFAKVNGIEKDNIEDVFAEWKDRLEDKNVKVNDLVDKLLVDSAELMHQIAKRYSDRGADLSMQDTFNFNGVELSFFDIQMGIFAAKKQLDPYSEALADLVKYAKIDTKKHGKNINEQKQYLRGYNNMFSSTSKNRKRMMFDTESLDRLVSKSYIEQKTKNATRIFSEIFGNATIQGTDQFQDQIDKLMNITVNDDYGNANTIGKLSGAILAKRKSVFINNYAKLHNIDIKGLVDGNNTIFDRLGRLKIIIMTDPRYAHLRGTDGEVNNYMLRTLIQGKKYKYHENLNMGAGTVQDDYTNAKFIDTFSFIDDESINADDFTEGWTELLNDNSVPEIQEFARDLIVYSFVVATDNGGNHDLFRFVPNQWKINPENEDLAGRQYAKNSYAEYMENLLSAYRRGQNPQSMLSVQDIDDILLNNWYDDTFIKKEWITYDNETRFEELFLGSIMVEDDIDIPGFGRHKETVPVQLNYPSILCGIKRDGDSWDVTYNPDTAPLFIKIPRKSCNDKISQRRFNIYKYVGVGTKYNITTDQNGGTVKQTVLYPIYAMVNARGNQFDGGNKIYAYGLDQTSDEAMFGARTNELIQLAEKRLTPEERSDLPTTLLNLSKRYANWSDVNRKTARRLAGEQFGDVVADIAENYLPQSIDRQALENWSKKEGWSINYFVQNVWPNIGKAYQLEFQLLEDQSTPYEFSGRMDMSYDGNQRNDITSDTTIEAIKNGERTATTRYTDSKHFDYWQDVQEGDVIEWHDDNGNSVRVVCTSPLTRLANIFEIEDPLGDSRTSLTTPQTQEVQQPDEVSRFLSKPDVHDDKFFQLGIDKMIECGW